jgi:aryl-alcohol dehydrogenase-like predicted oxidoreductase
VKFSKISLGTVQFGIDYGISPSNKQVNRKEIINILNYAKQHNIDLLDTAPAYGDSELVLGESNIDNFKIVTKTRHFNQDILTTQDAEFLSSDFNKSLKLLKQKSVYGLMIHNADDLLKLGADNVYNQLKKLKQEGLIAKIGVSIYNGDQLQKIIDQFDIDLVQLPFNILDRRLISSGMLQKLNNLGVEVHARSIFLQGLLLMNKDSRTEQFNRWDNLWRLWHEWLNDNKITALEATIRYAISKSEISKVLVGVNSTKQLQEIIQATKGSLPKIPNEIFTEDINLLNPSNWSA